MAKIVQTTLTKGFDMCGKIGNDSKACPKTCDDCELFTNENIYDGPKTSAGDCWKDAAKTFQGIKTDSSRPACEFFTNVPNCSYIVSVKNVGEIANDFGYADDKGRRVGYLITEEEIVLADANRSYQKKIQAKDGDYCGGGYKRQEPGTYTRLRTNVTRDGKVYGAIQERIMDKSRDVAMKKAVARMNGANKRLSKKFNSKQA